MARRNSRHRGIPTYDRPDGTRLLEPRTAAPREGVRQYRVREGDRLDLLAWRFLGDPQLYWQIADANPVQDPRELLEPGRILQIPERG